MGTADLLFSIESGIARGWHTGAQVCVIRQGQVETNAALGQSSPGTPLTPDSILLWLSAGKPLLAAGLALLWQDHLLSWDDPVVRYLPEFGTHGKDALTLRHLLDHTGGFRAADPIRERSWPAQIAAVCATRREPNWKPGAKQGYHLGGSWTILGAVLERITGERLGPWLRQHLFLPLGMTSTWTGMPPEPEAVATAGLALMHESKDGRCTPHPFWSDPANLQACWPGSNTFSTARDLARFYQALLDGGHGVLEPATVRELTIPAHPARPDATFKRPMRFHLGLLYDSKQPGESWHAYGYGAAASPSTFGHSGNQCTVAFADPARRLAVALAFNAMPGEPIHQQRTRQALDAL
jgi:CubicO group peptidase (beta-lactamase class C family)